MLLAGSFTRHLLLCKPPGSVTLRHCHLQRTSCTSLTLEFESARRATSQQSGEGKISGGQMVASPAPMPFLIGVAGGTASGKTSVCRKIMAQLNKDVPVSCEQQMHPNSMPRLPISVCASCWCTSRPSHGTAAGPSCAESKQQHCRKSKVSSTYHKIASTVT